MSTKTQRTRAAIARALAEILAESGTAEFSVQDVADRAGVTHRTVYNHFPNRGALMDGLENLQEDASAANEDAASSLRLDAKNVAATIQRVYSTFAGDPSMSHAVAMLGVSAGRPSERARLRTEQLAASLLDTLALSDRDARAVAAAIRMFGSQLGWHLLTDHYALTQAEAEATATWAARVLMAAAAARDLPSQGSHDD